jgi:multidrug efflux pump subunit AcrA (membrane-fusion protein)
MTKTTKIITALLIGVIVAFAIISIKHKKHALADIPTMKSYAVVVSTLKTKKEPVRLTLPYIATLMSDATTIVSSKFPARVESIMQSGSTVKKGDTLVVLDTHDLKDKEKEIELQIDSTKVTLLAKKTALSTAQASHERTKELMRVKAAPQEKFDREVSTIQSITAGIETLTNKIKILHLSLDDINHSLGYGKIQATQNGMVSKTFVHLGDMAMPGKPLLEIEGEGEKYIILRMPDDKTDKAVVIDDQVYPLHALHHTFNGLLEYRADINTTRISGERITLSLVTYTGTGITVPLNALLQKEGKNYCFVVQGTQADAKEVHIVARGENAVVITGLKEGEQIVLAKPDLLLQILGGKPVHVLPSEEQ